MHSLRRLLTTASVLGVVVLASSVQGYSPGRVKGAGGKATSPKKQPGFCIEPEDCKVAGYECVALQTTRAGTEEVKQCLPKKTDTDVCSGQFPGLCPSFASWTEPYKLISSVCTYKPAKKCAKDPSGESVKGEVVCVPGAKDADDKPLAVIYGCVDIDIAAKKLGFTDKEDAGKLAKQLGTAKTVMEACLSPDAGTGGKNATAPSLLCQGHGTCVPTSAASNEYQCRCNVGYSGDYCDSKDSNKCALPGQCAAGVCNLEKQQCECPAGTTGNQCADCDASSSSACNGNGQCTDKQCTCNEGFFGDHCDQKVKATSAPEAAGDSSTSMDANVVGGNTAAGRGAVHALVVLGTAVAASLTF